MARTQPRRAAGTPVGGQWAPSSHDEPDIDLRAHPKRRAAMAVAAAVPLALSASAATAQAPPARTAPGQVLPAWHPDVLHAEIWGRSVKMAWLSPATVPGRISYQLEIRTAPTWQAVPKNRGGVVVVTDSRPLTGVRTTLTGLQPGRAYTLRLVGYHDGHPFGAIGPDAIALDPVVNAPWPSSQCPAVGPRPPQAPPGLSCNDRTYLVAIDKAREVEGLGPMVLPAGYAHMSAPDQILVVTNIERGSRGLPTFAGLSARFDHLAEGGARTDSDPSGPTNAAWSSNWAGTSNALEADFMWMYADGYSKSGSYNLDCKTPVSSGCWGHRQDILGDYGSQTEMGAAVYGANSAAQLFVLAT